MFFFNRLIRLTPSQKDIFVIFAHRAWQAVSGLLTLVLITYYLSPIEQGYYYTLLSIAALYMAFDMGLSTALVQFSAREFIGLYWNTSGEVQGGAKSRFLALINLSFRWYGFLAIIFLLIYPAGIYFIDSGNDNPFNYDWHVPWLILVGSTAVLLLSLPILSIKEGSGQIIEVYSLRLMQSVVGSIVVWIVLVNNGGLYAIAMVPLLSAIIAIIWIFFRFRCALIQSLKIGNNNFNWNTEVWPLQWRFGTSWLSGYMLISMHTPLLFYMQGPIEAGQMGVTMTIANMLSMLSLSWVTSKIPKMTKLASIKEWSKLDNVYWNVLFKSCAAYTLGAVIFFLLRLAFESSEYSNRFLPTIETAWLLVAMGFYHISGIFSTYLRIHMKEPFLWLAIIGSTLTLISAIFIVPQWGTMGVVVILTIVNALFFFPAVLLLWIYLRKKWHDKSYVT
jgi:O-antigen/teichoic acid export membrane protein